MSEKGKIKKITDKGFGFIKYSGGEIFFHISDVSEPDKEKIAVGGEVAFVLGKGKDGRPAAKQVRIISQQGHGVEAANSRQAMQAQGSDSVDSNYYLPKNTLQTIDPAQIDNFSLMFHKTAHFEEDKFIFYKRDRYGNESLNLAKKYNSMAAKYTFINPIYKRHKDSISQLLGDKNTTSSIFSPNWRLIVGIGHESVYEISITLHHIYGIPYIPGQAVKGVTRSWIITEVFNQDEKAALKDELFCRIFGSPKDSAKGEHQGSVMFFDAFPTVAPKLEVDIMNPHYGDYYQGKKPPADYLNPVPIPFLTVNATPFEFIIGMKLLRTKDVFVRGKTTSPLITNCKGLNEDSSLLNVASSWLNKALTEHGIGAKTAVGYGYFQYE